MKYYPNSPLLYEKGFSIIINDEALSFDSSICYYFDYDQRSHSVNMDFPHFHSFYELMILLSPKAYHFVNGTRYDLASNDIVLLAPSVLHQSEYPPGTPSDRIIIGFLFPQKMPSFPGAYKEILSVFNSPCPVFRFHREEQNLLFSSINDIADISQRTTNPAVRNLMIHNKFVEFLFILYSLKDQNHYTPSTEGGIKEKIYSITSYIHQHYGEDISLTTLADAFYISPYYLSHQFKEVTGYTVVQYIQLTRIKNAQYLLLNSNEKITQIAEATGFSSFSQFNRVFRKLCQTSPSDYKAEARKSSTDVTLTSVNQ